MLGKLIGAAIGERAARQFGGVSGTGGALIGAIAPAVLRRLGPVGMIAAMAGGYALKRIYDKQQQSLSTPQKAPAIAGASMPMG